MKISQAVDPPREWARHKRGGIVGMFLGVVVIAILKQAGHELSEAEAGFAVLATPHFIGDALQEVAFLAGTYILGQKARKSESRTRGTDA